MHEPRPPVLARLLAQRKMTQEELAQRSGVARETINRLCRGRRVLVRPATVAALAWALDVPATALRELLAKPGRIPIGPRRRPHAEEAP